MTFLLLFFDMNNIYTFSGWWYFWSVLIEVCGAGFNRTLRD